MRQIIHLHAPVTPYTYAKKQKNIVNTTWFRICYSLSTLDVHPTEDKLLAFWVKIYLAKLFSLFYTPLPEEKKK